MKYNKLIFFTLIAIVLTDAFTFISWVGALNIDKATYISIVLTYLSIAIFTRIAYIDGFGYNDIPNSIKNLYKLWLIWSVFNLVRGVFLATDYWDWKTLFFSSLSFSLIPLVFFLGKNIQYAKIVFVFALKYLFPLGFLFIPLAFATNQELYSRLMIPISLFILFIPYIKIKWKILVIIVTITSILMTIGFRSNIIKIGFSLLLLLIYFFQKFINLRMLRLIHLSLFIVPLLLLYLAATNQYNIFESISKNEGYQTTNNRNGIEDNLMADTRTFLYVETFAQLNKTGNWVIGESAVGSYMSKYFYNTGGDINGKRYGSEVGILNILLRYGIIGVIIYFLLLYRVTLNAIRNSSNTLAKMMGLFIAFRFTFSFVEEYTQYDLNFYFFWLAIGLVSSSSFRDMNDSEIKKYLELR